MKRSSIFARVRRLISKEKTAGGITHLITSRNKSLSTRRRPAVDNKGSGERGRNRTFNLLIKSQLLCQLSYAPVAVGKTEELPRKTLKSVTHRYYDVAQLRHQPGTNPARSQ